MLIKKEIYEQYPEEEIQQVEIKKLPAGAYPIKILSVDNIDTVEKPYLYVTFDIIGANNPYQHYFKTLHDAFGGNWQGNIRLYYSDKAMSLFKSNIVAIQKSNLKYNFEKTGFDEKTLIGKTVIGLFGEYEYIAKDGTVKIGVRCDRFHSIEAWKENKIKVPPLRTLEKQGKTRPDETAEESSTDIAVNDVAEKKKQEVIDDDLPF